MKNTLKLNHTKKQIIMDRTFAKLSEDTRSEEYAHLQNVRRDYPTYAVIRRTIRKNENKECYKGLTYEYMREYIFRYEPADTRKSVLVDLEDQIFISKCHSQANRYPVIKRWFLDKYPEVAKFGMPKLETTTTPVTTIPTPEATELAIAV